MKARRGFARRGTPPSSWRGLCFAGLACVAAPRMLVALQGLLSDGREAAAARRYTRLAFTGAAAGAATERHQNIGTPRVERRRAAATSEAGAWPRTSSRAAGSGGGGQDAAFEEAVALAMEEEALADAKEKVSRDYGSINKPKPAKLHKVKTDVGADWNPLTESIDGLPRISAIRPEHIVGGTHLVVDQFGKDLERYQASLAVAYERPWRFTWEKFAEPLELMLDRVDRAWGTVGLLRDVNGSSLEVHDAHHQLLILMQELSMIFAQSEDFYKATHLLTKDKRLEDDQQRIVNWYVRQSWTGGAGLDDMTAAKEFNRRQHELAYLASLFAGNVVEDERQAWLVEDSSKVAGLPNDVLQQAAEAARIHGDDDAAEATAEDGPWLFVPTFDTYESVMQFATNREFRREMFEKYAKRGWREKPTDDDGEPVKGDNSWIVARMLELRRDWAKAIGKDSFVDLVMDSRMASKAQVDGFLKSIVNASLVAAEEQLQELQDFATSEGIELDSVQPWDVAYLRARRLQADNQALLLGNQMKPYFPLDAALEGLFHVVEMLFGIRIEERQDDGVAWRENVRYFRLFEVASDLPVAAFYFDAFATARSPGEPVFWTDPALSYSRSQGKKNFPRRPLVYFTSSVGQRSGAADTTLLSLRDVQDMFYAMGRALQEMLSEPREGLAAGTRVLELDAVDIVPRFLQLWATEPDVLRGMARHHKSRQTMPEDTIRAVAAAESTYRAFDILEEAKRAQVDLTLHSEQRCCEGSSDAVWEAVRSVEDSVAILPRDEEVGWLHSFMQPFSTGYAAAYYARLWSQVLAADLFEAFREAADGANELLLAPTTAELGRRLRFELIRPGGGRSPLESFKEFRGRIPRVAPFLRRTGLRKAPSDTAT
eukprot:TRINITY_DN29426_c0_g3_i1.p1 TRINITY_DN29426_c0_g3~~TRINITY_DN29426_c0_g3_i1.p1  ORF type:complete len:884 (+),score=181.84 TRINITY_DN29426_c0_g3_i1:61-2712(+)